MEEKPKVGVVMGSQSDWDVMQHAARVRKDFGVAFEALNERNERWIHRAGDGITV